MHATEAFVDDAEVLKLIFELLGQLPPRPIFAKGGALPGRKVRAACAGALRDFEPLSESALNARKGRVVVAYGRARTEAEELKADKSMKKRSKRNRAFLRPVVRPGFAAALTV